MLCIFMTWVNGAGTDVMKLNRELLPREKPTKEEILLAPESGARHDIDLKNRDK
jgi:hypothetical protein